MKNINTPFIIKKQTCTKFFPRARSSIPDMEKINKKHPTSEKKNVFTCTEAFFVLVLTMAKTEKKK